MKSLRVAAVGLSDEDMELMRGVAVALIAGGRSTRMGMGVDKGRLKGPDGVEFWRSRLEVLRSLGSEEVMISCRPDQGHFADSGARLVFDQWPDAGPMGGIVSCLEAMRADRLVVLGVDLPGITAEDLRTLLEVADPDLAPLSGGRAGNTASGPKPGAGAVFDSGEFFEPLAAVYAKTMAADGHRRLEQGRFSLQPWVRDAVTSRQMRRAEAHPNRTVDFRNVNLPGDLPCPSVPE